MSISRNIPSHPSAEPSRLEDAVGNEAASRGAVSTAAELLSQSPKEGSSSAGGASKHEDQVLEHAYDGILEYDNPMPSWWKNMFWGTFVFSLGYLFWYHLGGNGVSVQDAYESEMAAAQALAAQNALGQEVSEESLQLVLSDKSSVEEGGAKYASLCAPCHADKGQGLIGPNLTDDHWLHGGGNLMDIYDVVAKGVPDKGMPPWERQLTPEELRKVVAFVGSIRGTHVAGKAPEGNPVGGGG